MDLGNPPDSGSALPPTLHSKPPASLFLLFFPKNLISFRFNPKQMTWLLLTLCIAPCLRGWPERYSGLGGGGVSRAGAAGPGPGPPCQSRRHLGTEAPHLYLKMVQSLRCTGWVLPALTLSAPSHLVVLASKGDSAGRGQDVSVLALVGRASLARSLWRSDRPNVLSPLASQQPGGARPEPVHAQIWQILP